MVRLEVCVDSVASAMAAADAGAHRIELCAALSEDGLTPSVGLFQTVKQNFAIHRIRTKIFVMIRPRRGDFLYSGDEIDVMISDIQLLKSFGAHGFVFGALTEDGTLDMKACSKLIEAARPMPCTLHRAFDYTRDSMMSAETAIGLGFHRILTSGQQSTACKGLKLIEKLQLTYGDRIIIMPGGGVNDLNAALLVSSTGVKEVHSSASVIESSRMIYQHSFSPTSTRAEAQFFGSMDKAPSTRTTKPALNDFTLKVTSEDKVRALLSVLPPSPIEEEKRTRPSKAEEDPKPWLTHPYTNTSHL